MFFRQLRRNSMYLFPVLLFVAASLMHFIVNLEVVIIFLLQGVFFLWAAGVAFSRKYTFWPVFIFGVCCIILSGALYIYEEYNLQGVTKALAADDILKARELLESLDSEDIVKSNHYNQLQEFINSRVEQQVAELIVKAKGEMRRNDIVEAKKTLSLIHEYDSENKIAASMADSLKIMEIASIEKSLSPEKFSRLKALRKEVNLYLYRKNFTDARKSINGFIQANAEFKKDNLLITTLNETIDEKEKGAELAKERQLNYKKLDEALVLYKKKEYGDSADLLREVLKNDSSNKVAQRLLLKAEAKADKASSGFWTKFIIISIVLLVIIIYIKRNL